MHNSVHNDSVVSLHNDKILNTFQKSILIQTDYKIHTRII